MLQHAHDSTVAEGRHEFRIHVIGIEQIDEFAILQDSAQSEVGVFTGTGNALNRFGLEGNFKTVFAEYFTDDDASLDFVVCRLYGIAGKCPVDFDLFQYENQFARIVDLSLDAADFLMAHFRIEAVFFKTFNSLFQGRANDAVRALPVLFLQFLRGRKEARFYVLARRLDPEFQFRRRREYDFFDVVRVDG